MSTKTEFILPCFQEAARKIAAELDYSNDEQLVNVFAAILAEEIPLAECMELLQRCADSLDNVTGPQRFGSVHAAEVFLKQHGGKP